LAWQFQSEPLPVIVFVLKYDWPARVDERDITRCQFNGLTVVNHRSPARNLTHKVVVLNTVKADIPLCPLNTVSVARKNIHTHESAYASRPHLPDKSFRLKGVRIVSATNRPEGLNPSLIVQVRCLKKCAAPTRRWRQRVIGSTC
jgi:hypothetical protein